LAGVTADAAGDAGGFKPTAELIDRTILPAFPKWPAGPARKPRTPVTTGLKGVTMEFGDVGYVLSKCEPITVRIETEKGDTTYNFN
jgi:hypothetical protein